MSRRSSVYVIKVNYQVTTLEQFSVPEDKTCSEKTRVWELRENSLTVS